MSNMTLNHLNFVFIYSLTINILVVYRMYMYLLSFLYFQAHIGDIFRSKFSDFKNFHIMLYTCAAEFDFMEAEVSIYLKLGRWTMCLN